VSIVAGKIAGIADIDVLSCANDMSWGRIVLAALAGGVVTSITDWLFMGSDWLYKRYDRHPEIWRFSGQGETKAVIWASLLPFLTCAAFAVTCAWLQVHSFGAAFILALAVWIIASLPLTIANTLFIKVSPAIAAAHAFGWLVKLTIAAAAVALIAR